VNISTGYPTTPFYVTIPTIDTGSKQPPGNAAGKLPGRIKRLKLKQQIRHNQVMSVQKKRTRDIAAKHRVVLTGSECTGKTQIVQALAAHFDCPFSAEGARLYLDRQSMALTAQDIEPIACEQIAQEDAAVGRASELTIHDTDLLSTVIYARHYYQHCPDWIVDTAHSRARGLYLLCDIDLPWVSDGLLRDRGMGGQRAQLHSLFVAMLNQTGQHWMYIRGIGPAREQYAIAAVANYLAKGSITPSHDIDSP
jgi:nicotinamide riboside kinase